MARKRFSKPLTAGELMEQLQQDPEWAARTEARERWHQARVARVHEQEQPLLRELAAAGCVVSSIDDLVNAREPYPEALPVLLEHLKKVGYPSEIREGIARALTVRHPMVKEAIPVLLEAFAKDPDTRLNGPKWAIGNAVEVLYSDHHVDPIVDLALDSSHGPARTMLVWALRNSKTRRAREALNALTSDPVEEVALMARRALEAAEART